MCLAVFHIAMSSMSSEFSLQEPFKTTIPVNYVTGSLDEDVPPGQTLQLAGNYVGPVETSVVTIPNEVHSLSKPRTLEILIAAIRTMENDKDYGKYWKAGLSFNTWEILECNETRGTKKMSYKHFRCDSPAFPTAAAARIHDALCEN